MGKFKKAVGLVLSALMMVGAAVGIKPMMERTNAESADITISSFETKNISTTKATYECTAFSIEWLKNNSSTNISSSYSEMRLYTSHTFSITPSSKYKLISIVAKCGGGSNAKVSTLGGGSITNATKSTSGDTEATLTVKDGTLPVVITQNAQCRVNSFTINYSERTAPVETNHVTGVTLSQNSLTLDAGKNFQLSATVAPDNATNKSVTWTSDDEDVATVSSDGLITAVAAGTCNITVTTVDQEKSAVCALKVNAVREPDFSWDISKISNGDLTARALNSIISISDIINAGSTNVRFFNSTLRMYADESFTINVASGYKLSKMVFSGKSSIIVDAGTYNSGTWECGDDNITSVVIGKGSGDVQLSKIEFYYDVYVSPTYKITFNPGAGTFKSGVGNDIIANTGDSTEVILPKIENFATIPEEFAVLTWIAGENTYSPGDKVVVSSSTNFVANWSGKTVTIAEALSIAKAVGTDGTVYQYNASGKLISLSADRKTGIISDDTNEITFFNYNAFSDNLVPNIGQTIKVEGKIVVYSNTAEFSPAAVTILNTPTYYTVSFDLNGGTDTGIYGDVYVLDGHKLTEPAEPKKEKYDFAGWLNDGVKWNFNDNVTSNMNLVASWTVGQAVETFESLGTKASLSMSFTSPTISYTKVTNVNDLHDGDVIALGCSAKSKAAGPMKGNAYLTSVDATFEDGKMMSNGLIDITLTSSGDEWILSTFEGTIYTSAAKAFNLTGNGTNKWSISITDGIASITSTTSSYGTIKYNSSSPRFLNYTSGQTGIEIYKKTSSGSYSLKNVGIRFGITTDLFTPELYSALLTKGSNVIFGVALCKGATFVADSAINQDCPVDVDNIGDKSFAVVLRNITDYAQVISAKIYVCIDGTYHYGVVSSFSANSLATEYLTNHSTEDGVKENLGILTYLSTAVYVA